MLRRMQEGESIDPRFTRNFQMKRMGKDKDDIFWFFGKIHGLENLAYVDPAKGLATRGDPWKLQMLVNDANDNAKPLPAQSFDKLV
jgi:hypothetical protein